jgi:hypothetical protein
MTPINSILGSRQLERTRDASLSALLIVEILLIFVVLPLEANDRVPAAVLTIAVTLFLITSFLVTLQSRSALIIFATSGVLSQFISLLHDEHFSTITAWFDVGARHTAICAVSWVIARMVFGSGQVTVHRIEAAIVLFLNIGLLFFTTYRFVLSIAPEAFSGRIYKLDRFHFDLLYFSLATMIGIDYRGITPVGSIARALVGIESLIGLLYPVIVLIRFFTLQMKQKSSRSNG